MGDVRKRAMIYQVTYSRIDWNKYFSGYDNYYSTCTKLFSTKEAAEEFVRQPLIEYVPTYGTTEEVKRPGEGCIDQVTVE